MVTKQSAAAPIFQSEETASIVRNEKTTEVMNYQVFTDKLENLDFRKRMVINTINQYSYCIAEQDPDFKAALKQSDILLPDGVGITLAAKLLLNTKIKKIAGADIHKFLLNHLQETHGSCFYLGSSEGTLKKIRAKVATQYKNVVVGTYSPPYKSNFNNGDIDKMIQEVNAFNPDVLFVGMTAPKQEKWATRYKYQVNAKVICSIGAVFDFYAGTVDRPDRFWIDLGLEWFIRMVKEPKRMWKRYLVYGPKFLYYIFKEKSRLNKTNDISKESPFLYKL